MKLWKKIATVLMSFTLCLPALAACNNGGGTIHLTKKATELSA